MHCGPPIDAMISGIVMNGPTPTMLLMLRAVACTRPNPRTSASFSAIGSPLPDGRQASRYLTPTTIESGPTSASTRVSRKPAFFIHPLQSAPE